MDIATLSKRKKNILLVVFIAFGILAICGIAGVFMLNYNTFLPSAPSILDDGNSILITTVLNENYQGYRFRFQSTSADVILDSTSNILTGDQLEQSELVVGTNYRVSVCYVAETEGGVTEYSESVSWVYSKYLASPILSLDEGNQIITWQEVDKADYYTVHYKEGKEYQSEIASGTYFDYASLSGGDKEVYVVAHSVKGGYKSSSPSEKLTFVHTYKLKDIKETSFDKDSKYLTVKTEEKIDYLTIYINGQSHVAKLTDPTRVNKLYVYKINIVTIYEEDAEIGVAPYPQNRFYSFAGNILYI